MKDIFDEADLFESDDRLITLLRIVTSEHLQKTSL